MIGHELPYDTRVTLLWWVWEISPAYKRYTDLALLLAKHQQPIPKTFGGPEELSHICNISGGGEGMTGEVGHTTWNTKVVDQHEEVVATVWCCIPIPAGRLSCKLLCTAMID